MWSQATGIRRKGCAQEPGCCSLAQNSFWGRILAAISSSSDRDSYGGFGPLMLGFESLPANGIPAPQAKLGANPNVGASLAEPIQVGPGLETRLFRHHNPESPVNL